MLFYCTGVFAYRIHITVPFLTAICKNYNVFPCYDSQNCKPKFYDGHLHDDFDYAQAEPNDGTIDGYINYLNNRNDELPDNFYMRRKTT